MHIRVGYEIAIDCPRPTPIISVLDIRKERQPDVLRQTRVLTSPQVGCVAYEDSFGNVCRRYNAPAGTFRILFDAVVRDGGKADTVNPLAKATPIASLPSDTIRFLLGSRYCETDHLSDLAWRLFGDIPAGWGQVQAVVDYVHQRLSFGYGYARSTRTASQAHDERVGVCRDFAHLAIAFCRCLNIPARYVNGYLGDIGVPADPAPMDFSAWFEAYLDGRWYTFDARHNHPRIGRIPIAFGLDATDVPLLHTFGPHNLSYFRVTAHEEQADVAAPPPVNRMAQPWQIA